MAHTTPDHRNPSRADADRRDAIVVGGGLAGLTAAAALARAGRRVELYETRHRLGGRATTEDRNGVLFNQGPHALYTASCGLPVLRGLGIEPAGASPGSASAGVLHGRVAMAASGLMSLLTTKLLGPRGRVHLAKAFAGLGRVRPADWDHRTVADWVMHTTTDDDVAAILHGLVRLSSYADAPDVMSAGAAVAQLQTALKGVLYLHGGWQQLVGALERVALDAGATLTGGHAVTALTACDNGDSWTVHTAQRAATAPVVILAGLSPTQAGALLGDPAAFAHAGPPVEAAVLDRALGRAPAHSVLIDFDAPHYFSVHGPVAELCPAGTWAVVAAKYVRPGSPADAGADRAALTRHCALAGAADGVLDERFLMRMTVTHGLPLAARGGLAGRPGVAIDDRPGVFVAGDWVGAHGLLADATLASASLAAALADKHLQQR